MATPLSSSPSIPGYNHIPSQYVDYYAMIQGPRENDPSKLLLCGQSRECQEGPAAPLGAHCSTAAGELQVCRRMASADVNSPMLPPSLSPSSSSSPLRIARSAAAAAPRDSGHCRGDPRREEGGHSALLGACEKLIILLYSPGDLRAAKAVQESVPAIPSKSPSPEHHRSRLARAGPPALPVPLIPRGDVTGSQCGQRWLLRVAEGGTRRRWLQLGPAFD